MDLTDHGKWGWPCGTSRADGAKIYVETNAVNTCFQHSQRSLSWLDEFEGVPGSGVPLQTVYVDRPGPMLGVDVKLCAAKKYPGQWL